MVAVLLSAVAGHPGRLITGTSETREGTPTARVGLGEAAGIPPKLEQEPTLMIAAAPSAASRRCWIAVLPAIVQ